MPDPLTVSDALADPRTPASAIDVLRDLPLGARVVVVDGEVFVAIAELPRLVRQDRDARDRFARRRELIRKRQRTPDEDAELTDLDAWAETQPVGSPAADDAMLWLRQAADALRRD